jgi:hypothetical protein
VDTGHLALRICYRLQQFLAGLIRSDPIEEASLAPYLNSAQRRLFRALPTSEQQHALHVLQTLQAEGHEEVALAQAALFHDVGKVVPSAESRSLFGGIGRGKAEGRVRLWHRVVKVLLQAVHPTFLHRLAADDRDSWRYPFFILLHHAALGAERASEAGVEPLAVSLIHWHHTSPEESDLDLTERALLAALRSADEQA